METLFRKHDRYMQLTPMTMFRSLMTDINWRANLIIVRGARGVGKSTLLRQYVRQHYDIGDRSVLYCSLDSVYFASHSLLTMAEAFYQLGGKLLLLDEVHKYATWSKEVKEINDLYPDLHLVLSGSSMLQILNGDADLSRRSVSYELRGLSFREYLYLYKDIRLAPVTLPQLLQRAPEICAEVCRQCRPLQLFQEYLQCGYYPFYQEDTEGYGIRLEQVARYVVETELPQQCGVDSSQVRKIMALLGILSDSVPFEVNMTSLAKSVEANRTTVLSYLIYLERARLLSLLYSDVKSVKKMQKPDKVYVENTNMLLALASVQPHVGTLRETFALNQLSARHVVEYGKEHGDFVVDSRYTFEVGGPEKGFKQIAGLDDAYVLADGIEMPLGRKLPLWLVGMLY